jgi:hypothetical protein
MKYDQMTNGRLQYDHINFTGRGDKLSDVSLVKYVQGVSGGKSQYFGRGKYLIARKKLIRRGIRF